MPTSVLICDDSAFARKQMARSLPGDWNVEIEYATHGKEAIALIKEGKGSVLFLDLNMPVMDGYSVLESICSEDLSTMVVVVSGDIQPEAYKRVLKMGALDFIKKPVNKNKLSEILDKYGIFNNQSKIEISLSEQLRDAYQEITNVAMGQAADLLARLLNVFVILPTPNVNIFEVSELHMALNQAEHNDTISAVCQGFLGSGISGEALIIFNDSSFSDIAKLMKYEEELNESVELELIMDIASILIGAILNGLADELDLSFSQGHPVVLGRHCAVSDLIESSTIRWKKTLAIEFNYSIENHNIDCDLLLLFSEDSLDRLQSRVELIMD